MQSSIDDGYIKYVSECRDGEVSWSQSLEALNRSRTDLFDLGHIGVYPNGVGFGNLSVRTVGSQFVITGSATGSSRVLQHAQFSLVESFSIANNTVKSRGTLHASSESMTHGAIYLSHPGVHCVIHIHSRLLFDTLLLQGYPATAANIPYGTPAMAHAVQQLVLAQPSMPAAFVMAGHDEGVMAYGTDVRSVHALLVGLFQGAQEA
jgi:ribulose-5-phosphate 4-epimerase/fuculose-1-phosphate aldolase